MRVPERTSYHLFSYQTRKIENNKLLGTSVQEVWNTTTSIVLLACSIPTHYSTNFVHNFLQPFGLRFVLQFPNSLMLLCHRSNETFIILGQISLGTNSKVQLSSLLFINLFFNYAFTSHHFCELSASDSLA